MNIFHVEILNKSWPRLDTYGTPDKVFFQELKKESTLIPCLGFDK